jgi:phage terminase small subunit
LIASYAVAICQERTACHHLRTEGHVVAGRVSPPWIIVAEKAHRAMTTLATRLRLSPQSRARVKVRPANISAYERMELEDGNDDD